MPRMFDYDAGDILGVTYSNRSLNIRLAGRLEDESYFFGPGDSFLYMHHQFEASVYDTALMDEIFSWIDQNVNEKWFWYENLVNHGRSVVTCLWFNSDIDASVFKLRWGDQFKARQQHRTNREVLIDRAADRHRKKAQALR